jgi:RNA polymerase sigma factor (sigma-70 family)
METERRNLIRQSKAKKRTAQLVSIDGEVMVGNSTKPLVEFIEDKRSTDELEMTGVIQEFMKGLSEVEKKLFTCKYIGLSTGEICERMGVSRQRVSAVQQQIRKKYQMMFVDSKPKMMLRMGVQN